MQYCKKSKYLFLIFIFISNSWAYDPKLIWLTLETKHFSIHYYEGEEKVAEEVAKIAENVFEKLTNKILWSPSSKTQIVILDTSDSANGSATIYPYKIIKIFLSSPEESSSLDYYDNWLLMLLIHEYTHILHLDMVHGLPKVLKFFLGNIISPNGLQPEWMIEGYATFQETVRTEKGRGNSSLSEMILRSAILEDNFISIDRASGSFKGWPSGEISYIFGVKFHQFLAQKYGEEKIADMYHSYSGRIVPFFINTNSKKVLGEKLTSLWEEWKKSLEEKYNNELKIIKSQGLTKSYPLTNKNNYTYSPKFSPDGKTLIYSYSDLDSYPKIYKLDLATSKEEVILKNYNPKNISWGKDGKKIIFSAKKIYKKYYFYNDIFIYDVEKRKLSNITSGLRASDPDLHPDNEKILFVSNKLGTNNLGIYNLNAKQEEKIKYITENQNNKIQYSTPRWSPDGKLFVVSIFHEGGFRDIALFEEDGKFKKFITYDLARDIQPTWSQDGRYILFSSDRTRIPNIFAYDLYEGNFYQVTNVITGAFSPDISPDMSKIAFILYSSKGYNIHLIEFNPTKWKLIKIEQEDNSGQKEIKDVEFSKHKYNPLKTLFPPKVLIPDYKTGSIESIFSLYTTNMDALEHHIYSLSLSYRTRSKSLGYSLSYTERSFSPALFSGISQFTIPRTAKVFSPQGEYVGRILTFEGRFQIYLGTYFDWKIPFGVRYLFSYRYMIGKLPFLIEKDPAATPYFIEPPEDGIISAIHLSVNKNNTKSYPLSISKEKGREISYELTYADKILGSDFRTLYSNFDWREYLSLIPIKHHVIGLRFVGGTSFGDPLKTYFLGGAFGESYFTPSSSTLFILRGYPDFVFNGGQIITGSIEYRFPLFSLERGYKTLPIFIDRFHIAVFFDYGNAFDKLEEIKNFHYGTGGELRGNTTLCYNIPLTFRLGFASGLKDKEGINTFYLELGTSF